MRPYSAGRRAFLAGGTAAFASGLLCPHGLGAQAAPVSPRRIDVHNHLIPPPYLEAMRKEIIAGSDTDPAPVINWNPAHLIEEMDKSGVATALLSMSTPGLWVLNNRDRVRKLARSCNEYAAALMRDHPGRFGMFAAMPLPDVDGALAEAVYALDVLKADGIGLLTSYAEKYPGDPSFKPLFAELNRRKAVVFVHPTSPQCCANSLPGIASSLDEFMFDVTRAITSMLFSGTFSAYPEITFIFTHAGGTMTPISSRINAFGLRHHEYDAVLPHGVMYELKKLYYDIANSTNPSAMPALLGLVPPSQIMFGSDTPYVPIAVTAGGFDRMTLGDDTRAAINRGNAERLFPRLAHPPLP
jgi:predicted TIM-barrel fold metal-dependent hydrolase